MTVDKLIRANQSIGQLVVNEPSLTRIFERLGIDYCCGGKRTLQEACAERGLDVNSVVQTLNAVRETQKNGDAEQTDWSRARLSELCDHIETTHHQYLRDDLPRLHVFVDRVSQVHGDAHPELHQLRDVFNELSDELLSHIQKEERVLFPLIRQLDNDQLPQTMSVSGPINQMEAEHDSSGDALKIMRKLTNDYTPPADACGTYHAMLTGLELLEKDLHQHIHKENNILFPRAIDLETAK